MPESEEIKGEGFEVLGHEEPESEAQEAEGKAEEAGEQAGTEAAVGEEEAHAGAPGPIDVYSVIRFSIAQLAAVAWQKMGLQADPVTNQMVKDIEQARVAIDAASGLAEKLRPHLQGQEAKDYQALLTDLRLNFVKQSGDDAES